MSLELTGIATVKHVNLRKEGPQENQTLACDLKMQTTQSADVLAYFHSTLRNLLFTAEGTPQIPNLKPIEIEGSVRNLEATLDNNFVLLACEAKKFTFEPLAGERVLLTFSLTYFPLPKEVSRTAEFINQDIKIDIKGQASLLDSMDGKPAEAVPAESGAPRTIEVYVGKKCPECGKGGATNFGVCLECAAARIKKKVGQQLKKKTKPAKNASL